MSVATTSSTPYRQGSDLASATVIVALRQLAGRIESGEYQLKGEAEIARSLAVDGAHALHQRATEIRVEYHIHEREASRSPVSLSAIHQAEENLSEGIEL